MAGPQVVLASLLLALAPATCATTAAKPHLFLVLGDDLGFYDTAIYNPTSPTPNLAALAKVRLLQTLRVFCAPTPRARRRVFV